jgi:hypothetical protein
MGRRIAMRGMSSSRQSLRAGTIHQLVPYWPVLLLAAGALLVVPTLLVFWLAVALAIRMAGFLVALIAAAARHLPVRAGGLGRVRPGGFS